MSPIRSSRLTRDAQRLLALTEALSRSSSRLEDIYWENLLGAGLLKVLQGRKNKTIEKALDHLIIANLGAYEILVEQAETLSESLTLDHDGVQYDALMFSAPLVAWTRYQLPEGELTSEQVRALAAGIREHVIAEGAQLAVLPRLVSFDQMPQSFHDTRVWTQRLAAQALGEAADMPPLEKVADQDGMLADARFLVGVVVVPRGQALFRWQTEQENALLAREQSFAGWERVYNETLASVFTGCHVEYLPPDAYYLNSREADRRIRPLALKAAVTWLQAAAHLPGSELRAVIAPCGESVVEEYRVGFSTQHSNDVIYGCIWPVLSKEEAASHDSDDAIDIPDEIAALLKELGVSDVRRLPGLYAIEFCDDCGAPYFPSALGEMLHPELPEETDLAPVLFH
jgi:hypothetical protein